MRLEFDSSEVTSNEYACAALNTAMSVANLRALATGTTSVAAIYTRDLLRMPIVVPPPPEQREIAAALEDLDALLEGLEQLIVKKRDLKQVAMQQLLTGKTRLQGFSDHWHAKRLNDDIILLSGHHILAQYCNTRAKGVPYLTGPADFPQSRIVVTKFTDRPGAMCLPNDILVTVKGSGSGTIVLSDGAYCISRQLMAIRVQKWDNLFTYYSLLQNAEQFRAASTGLIPGLSRSDILDQELPIPPNADEQKAIAAVLTDMDAELVALELRLAKTRDLKQAMMQELLTGKTRLVTSEAIHA
jgi:type I restriction enzyme S subunit